MIELSNSVTQRLAGRILLVAALTSSAAAKPKLRPLKLTKAEQAALDLADEWVAKLADGPRSLTSPKLVSIALTNENTTCPMTTSAARGLPCLQTKVAPKGKPTIWRYTLGGPLLAHLATINRLAKGGIVIQLDEGCDDSTENQLLLVIKNKLVIGAFAQTYECSE